MPKTKSVAVQVKAAGPGDDAGLQEGQFTALASVFGNVDDVGDVVMPGAFTETLADWKARGDVIPLYWSHRMDDPAMCIGAVLDAQETDTGLAVKAQLDLDNPTGAQVYKLLKGRRVSRMSFAYDVLDGGWGERDNGQVYELRKLGLHEVSVVQVPANPAAAVQEVKRTPRFSELRPPKRLGKAAPGVDADLAALVAQIDQAVDACVDACSDAEEAVDVLMTRLGLPDADDIAEAAEGEPADDAEMMAGKALQTKAGRVLSAKNEKALRTALTKISAGVTDVKSVLAALDTIDEDEGKASPTQHAAAVDSAKSATGEPARSSPVSARLEIELAALEGGLMPLFSNV